MLALASVAVVGLVGLLVIVARITLPPDLPQAQTSIVLDAQDRPLAQLHAEQNRVPVPLSGVAKVMQQAIVAAEDRGFYHHSGLDPRGIVRALFSDVRGKQLQGGSTITQQLVKNSYLSPRRSLTRKVREAILAVKVEQRYSKRTILERYLNTIYFGRGAYGIEAAARAYFGRAADQLDLAQAGLLAGLVHAPETDDPIRFADRATARRRVVLDAMVTTKAITGEEARAAAGTPLGVLPAPPASPLPGGPRGYFVDWVRQQVAARFGERLLYSGGLRIHTTLDSDLQAAAETAVATVLPKPDDPPAALVALDDGGRVVAFVGGKDFTTSNVDLALGQAGGGSGRQAGSTFKAFVLGAAIEGGIPVRQTWPAPPQITLNEPDGPWPVANFDHESFGHPLDLFDATAHSVNTVYAQLIDKVGPKNVAEYAKRVGITSRLDPVPSLTLGTSDVSPLDMADAFMTFADRGERLTPFSIARITDAAGAVLLDNHTERERVIPREHADLVNNILQGVVDHGTGTAAKLGRDVAGKTGTTNDFADAWFVGYTPKLAAAVWMGYPESTAHRLTDVHGRSVTGGLFPAQIWKQFMATAVKGKDTGSFVAPPSDLLAEPTTTATLSPSSTAPVGASNSTVSTAPAATTTTKKPNSTTTVPTSTTTTKPPPTTTTTHNSQGHGP